MNEERIRICSEGVIIYNNDLVTHWTMYSSGYIHIITQNLSNGDCEMEKMLLSELLVSIGVSEDTAKQASREASSQLWNGHVPY